MLSGGLCVLMLNLYISQVFFEINQLEERTINNDNWVVSGLKESEAESSLLKYARNKPHVFYRRLVKGPPPAYRWTAWKVALNMKGHFQPEIYLQLLQRKEESKWLREIKKDLSRTFPSHPLYASNDYKEKGQTILENILAAYSLYSTSTGYCQGMNFIVGFLLIISGFKEKEVFWALVILMKHKIPGDLLQVEGLEGLYSESLPLVETLQVLSMQLLERTLPTINKHIRNVEVPEALWIHKWHSTLFLYSFPLPHCIRIWDYIFGYGTSGILKVTIGVLKQLKSKLLKTDFAECSDRLRDVKEGLGLSSPDKLIVTAEKINIDWSLTETLRLEVLEKINQKIKVGKTIQCDVNEVVDDSLSAHSYTSNNGDQEGRVIVTPRIKPIGNNKESKCVFIKSQPNTLVPEDKKDSKVKCNLDADLNEAYEDLKNETEEKGNSFKSDLVRKLTFKTESEIKQESIAQLAKRFGQSSILESIYKSEQGHQVPY